MARNNDPQQENQVAVIQPLRMQMPTHIGEQCGVDQDGWRALTDAIFPTAKTVGAVVMALAYCRQRKLDIFARVVHIVPMRVGDRDVESVWPGIALQRIQAQRQEDFAGWDDCEFGPDKTVKFADKKAVWENGRRSGYEDVSIEVTFPEWARFTFYKMRHGEKMAMPGPKVWFLETFAAISAYCNVPNAKWARSPRQMIEKCAEAAALRRGWPDVFGNEYAAEEMEGRTMTLDPSQYTVVSTVDGGEMLNETAKAEPTRADFTQGDRGADDGRVHLRDDQVDASDDQVTGDPADDVGDGPTLAEQAAAAAAERAKNRVVAEKPTGFDDWQTWEDATISLLKCANSLKKLDEVTLAAKANFEVAPADARERVREVDGMRRIDFQEASK